MGNTRGEPMERVDSNALGKGKSIMRNGQEEQRQVWKIKNREEEWNGIEFNVQEGEYEWLQGCYVGTTHSVQIVPNLSEKFFMEGYFSCRLRAMGGKLVLMDCEDKEELKDLVYDGADWLSQWFSKDVDEDTKQMQREPINIEEDDGGKSQRCKREARGCAILVDNEVELASNKHNFSIGGINERKFTWYHSNGNQMSRIDQFLLSKGWLSKWCDTKQWGLTRTVSDHCPIMLKVQKVDWGPKPFKFFDAWLDDQGCKELISKGEQGQLTEEEINKRKEAFLDLWKNMNTKERMAQQKSRKTWLVNGDANTKFFHNCVKGKWKTTEMNSIQIKDSQLVDPTIMKEEIANFFENMFKEENCKRPKLEGIGFQQITEQDNASLVAPFTENEIKAAVWDCKCSKALSQDRFNFRFVRREWETIKGDMIGFIKEFQEKGKLVRGLNSSFIVLVPIVNNPQRIEEYRPISFISAVYKILAKLLANRLKKVLDQVIGEQQMAFISGRQLMDGVVVANEVVDKAKKKKSKSFLLKIDFEKVYDKVCWKFLNFMMQKLGFCATWRRWIMECLRTSQVSMLVNEGLNGMITMVVQKGLLEGVEVGSKGFKVSHLQFADGTILFGSAMEQNVWPMKGIMRSCELVLGLKVNFNKSQLLGIAVNEEWLDKMAWVLCYKKGNFPFKYLGVPIGGSNRKLHFWKPLVDVFSKKLSSWKGRFLFLGGKITLINSVLSSLPVFWMSMYWIPSGKDNKISQMGDWSSDKWKWDIKWRRELYSWEEQQVAELYKDIRDGPMEKGKSDLRLWIHSKDGKYSTRSAYQALTTEPSG
ncbi:hypothetical protein SLEP1_g23252 [Rubroshorea leprosula]|uniref:Reverse transcriptase domain-containing protein n=1 Tax=Rubroshorea leprosula TaxID=152421 RepID=A0AAV5JJ05_9ROSI|nr:hypothetical protein SLEP1_g23252 [Rubroshorea leprosula]